MQLPKLFGIALISHSFLLTDLQAREAEKFLELSEYIAVQSACSSYASYTLDKFSLAGFKSKAEAKEYSRMHFALALDAAEELVDVAATMTSEDVPFKKLKGKYCFDGSVCFDNKSQIAGMFAAGPRTKSAEEVMQREISCPDGAWPPCHAPEDPAIWGSKSAKLYHEKNCKFLFR